MSLFYRFKPQKDRSLRSVTTHLDGAGVTANEVTALGLCLALGAGRLAYYGHLYASLILFAAGVVCDALDGSLARISTMGTEFGLYFDGIADRFSELFFVSDAVQYAQQRRGSSDAGNPPKKLRGSHERIMLSCGTFVCQVVGWV